MLMLARVRKLLELFDAFCHTIGGKLAAYWDSHIDMISLMSSNMRGGLESAP